MSLLSAPDGYLQVVIEETESLCRIISMRNEWMVDHSNRVIAYYNGTPGGTRNTIEYAEKKGIEVVMLQEQAEE